MGHIIAVAIGGATGALLRFFVSSWTYAWLGKSFPYGTLAVNVLGSLLAGCLYVLLAERWQDVPELRSFLLIGMLGAFTTFSTFSIETMELLNRAEYVKALANMVISVLLCILAAGFGMMLGRYFSHT